MLLLSMPVMFVTLSCSIALFVSIYELKFHLNHLFQYTCNIVVDHVIRHVFEDLFITM